MQTVLTVLIVSAALFYLVWRFFISSGKNKGCGSCSACPAADRCPSADAEDRD